jgi:formimidoylglutamate deiminase
MKSYVAPSALLPEGWAADVTIVVDDAGRIERVTTGTHVRDAERLRGAVVPGMPNLHSHAFQRALAGRTGSASQDRDDSFWTWRQAMYAFLNHVDPDAFEAITAQAYVEMAKAGYTSVAEFHYVHHDPCGTPYADPAELAWRVVAAARSAGISLTLLPVFYAHAGFGGMPIAEAQRRFAHGIDSFSRLFDVLAAAAPAQGYALGVAPHSLRAVTPEEMQAILRLVDSGTPIHIHAAEQTREVDDCCAWSGLRPVEWLVANAGVDARWCLVHATHMTAPEVTALAASGAIAGVAPTTEADLGDGTFPGDAYLRAGGRFGVGSDSNAIIDPFAELRQLEWSQRLRLRRRNVLSDAAELSIGTSLWRNAAGGGARALAQNCGMIAAGAYADLLVLDPDEPALAGQAVDRTLDAAIFGPCRRPVRDVMRRGRWIVRDGRHPQEAEVLRRYRAALARIDAMA